MVKYDSCLTSREYIEWLVDSDGKCDNDFPLEQLPNMKNWRLGKMNRNVLNKECIQDINAELNKGNKIQLEYNKHTQEVKILRMNLKKIKVDKSIE